MKQRMNANVLNVIFFFKLLKKHLKLLIMMDKFYVSPVKKNLRIVINAMKKDALVWKNVLKIIFELWIKQNAYNFVNCFKRVNYYWFNSRNIFIKVLSMIWVQRIAKHALIIVLYVRVQMKMVACQWKWK